VAPIEQATGCESCGAQYPSDFAGIDCLFCNSPLTRAPAGVTKDTHQVEEEARVVDTEDDNDECLTLHPVNYLGGYPDLPDPLPRLYVDISALEFVMCDKVGAPLLILNMDDVLTIEAEGPTEIKDRVTVTRLLALGIFALAVPKAKKLAYIVVTTNDGEIIVSTTMHTALELRTLLNRYVGAHRTEPMSGPAQPVSAGLADELERLASLRERGLLTEDEFAEAKRLLFHRDRSA
jgi:hypothetical protein